MIVYVDFERQNNIERFSIENQEKINSIYSNIKDYVLYKIDGLNKDLVFSVVTNTDGTVEMSISSRRDIKDDGFSYKEYEINSFKSDSIDTLLDHVNTHYIDKLNELKIVTK